MSLAGWVRVNNNSGEDYENAQVRLVVGVVRLVEEIAKLAQEALRPSPQNDASCGSSSRLRAMAAQSAGCRFGGA